MRELLADNISLYNQLEDFRGHASGLRPRIREVPSLSSWVYCFAAYMAVLTPDPRTREMLAYCRLIFSEALKHGGNGWLEYDQTFRRQLAVDPFLPWHSLVPGLQAAAILSTCPSGGQFCTICCEPDHSAGQCALSVVQPPVYSRSGELSQWARVNICLSWNQGRCSFPRSCSCRHVYSVCRRDHRAIDCHDAPSGFSSSKRPAGPKLPVSSRS